MSDRSPVLYLSEMLAAMEKVERYIAGVSYEEFVRQEQLVDAVERNIEKIGEAAAARPGRYQKQASRSTMENNRRVEKQGDPPLFCRGS